MRVRYKNLFAFTGDAALPLLESFVVEAGRIVPTTLPSTARSISRAVS